MTTERFSDRYHILARVLHWLMAIGFVLMWGCGYAMTSLVEDDSNLQEFLFGLHISIGVLLLFLLILRIAIRLIFKPPQLPAVLTDFDKIASHVGHFGLYLLPAIIITIGWAETDFGGHGVKFFGITMPKIFPTMETLLGFNLETTTATLHRWFAYSMLVLAIVHVLAVIKHRWIDKHDVLYRMSFGNRR